MEILKIFCVFVCLASSVTSRGIIKSETSENQFHRGGPLIKVATNIRSSVSHSVGQPIPSEFLEGRSSTQKADQCPGVCITAGCAKAAARALERMNSTADPCEDFFEFSCGGFVKDFVIPDEKTSISSFSIISDVLKEKLRVLVEEEPKATDSLPTRMIKDLYSSCMNTSQVDSLGLQPLRDILKKMGGWPVVEGTKWTNATFDWIKTNYMFRNTGYSVDYLFDFSVTTDVKNSTRRMIWFDQPSLGMSREYLMKGINDSDVKAYLKYSVDTAKLLGAKEEDAMKEMKDVLLFQIKLANISLPREKRRNTTKLYNIYTLANLSKIIPDIPWVEYINKLLPPHLTVNDAEIVGVSDMSYFKNLTIILKETPKRVIANYMMWRLAAGSSSFLTEDIRDLTLAYSKVVTGLKTRPPRWKECLGTVSGRLSYALSSLYVRRHFDDNAKVQADELVRYVREEFRRVLVNSDWMDSSTKTKALKKADAIKERIGFPKELKNDTVLTDHYRNMTVNRGPYLANILSLGIYGTNYSFGRLREPIDKDDWKRNSNVAIANAFYSSIENAIKFPAGILQGNFFEQDMPKYMNFGAIGFVVGHEITHGFDDQGKQFDADGNLVNWWDAATEKAFIDKKQCFIYQYGNYTEPLTGLKLNGVNTQGENIADNGGIKQSYRAYQKWVAANGKEKSLPGLSNYTPNQLFWLSTAQVWCSKYRSQSLKLRILTGVHAPGYFRVLGPFSNSVEFAKDWKCKSKSKMNPTQKCQVWQ